MNGKVCGRLEVFLSHWLDYKFKCKKFYSEFALHQELMPDHGCDQTKRSPRIIILGLTNEFLSDH